MLGKWRFRFLSNTWTVRKRLFLLSVSFSMLFSMLFSAPFSAPFSALLFSALFSARFKKPLLGGS